MFATLGYWICSPFAWLVRLFYDLTGSYGVALILFTLVIKLIMFPFQIKSRKSMIRMSRLSGKQQEIQKKYANNAAKMNEEMQKLYQEEGVNPMSGCLWSFIPLPILIALYSIIRQPITHFMRVSKESATALVQAVEAAGVDISGIATIKDGIAEFSAYGQINLAEIVATKLPELGSTVEGWINVNYSFIGLDLAANPWDFVKNFSFEWAAIGLILIPILAGLSQLLISWYSMKTQKNSQAMGSMKTMMYMMPLMSVYIAFIMPAALGVYWIAQSVFSMIETVIMTTFLNKKFEEEENARYEAIQADRQRRMEEGRRQQEARKNQTVQKKTLKEKQKEAQAAKEKKAAKQANSTTEAGRVGGRPYARGRAYREDRYDNE